ncbi:MAG TPA: YqhA family protein, partial [Cyclobacteriaceae bacterium]|nr:YqhA family protein [Cyclobacteriaceae bacterium]
DFDEQEDRPHWIDNLDADRLKVKLATSLASISGVHLLKTFIDIHSEAKTGNFEPLKYEIIIHLVFIFSALVLAFIAKILNHEKAVQVAR